MIPVVTASQMKQIDRRSIDNSTAVSYSYMQRAAQGVVEEVEKLSLDPKRDEIALVCGKGHNGGDGFITGRMLADRGYQVYCYGVAGGEDLSGATRIAFDEYVQCGGSFFQVTDAEDLESFGRFSLIIDALLGIGISGEPRGVYRDIIDAINAADATVIAIDIPSGLDADSGAPGEATVEADVTVTLGYPKTGLLFFPGRYYTGQLEVRQLGYPLDIETTETDRVFLPRAEAISPLLPPRDPEGAKYDHGTITLVAGSRGMAGAATLAASAAMRSGCGMVYAVVPESLLLPLSIKLTEPVLLPAPETHEGTFSIGVEATVAKVAQKCDILCVGPGIARNSETAEAIRSLVVRSEVPVVLDGDGINAFAGHIDQLRECVDLVMTPHYGEWKRLFGELSDEPRERVDALREVAAAYGITILLKGSPTIVATPDDEAYILPVGNSGMATAGSGDVLTGIIASLAAQGAPLADAAVAGAVLHGFAGDLAAEKLGEYSVIASDIVEYLGAAFLSLEEEEK